MLLYHQSVCLFVPSSLTRAYIGCGLLRSLFSSWTRNRLYCIQTGRFHSFPALFRFTSKLIYLRHTALTYKPFALRILDVWDTHKQTLGTLGIDPVIGNVQQAGPVSTDGDECFLTCCVKTELFPASESYRLTITTKKVPQTNFCNELRS